MKALKISLITFGSLFVIVYLAFLLAIPAFVKLEDYNYELNNDKNPEQGLIIKFENVRVATTWNLSAGVKVGQINAFYKSGEKFAQIDNIDTTISLPYLVFKKIKINKIAIDKIITRLGVEKDGHFTIEKFIPSQDKNFQNTQTTMVLPYGLEFSENMPDVVVKKYSITFIDNITDKHYALKGSNFKVCDFILNKKIKFKAIGEMLLDKRKQISYDLDLTSLVMPDFTNVSQKSKDEKTAQFNVITIFKNLYKLNLTADIKAMAKLSGSMEDIKTDGKINISNLSAIVQGKQLPASSLNLELKEKSIKILADFYTDITEKASIDGIFKYGNRQYIDLNVKSNNLELKNLFSLVNAVLPLVGVTDLNAIKANGQIKANFNIKSDFKTINSSGFLKVIDANIYYNLYNVALKNIQADIDFSSNRINISKASADFNGAPLSLKGAIDTNAYANISILADKIPLKAALLAIGQIQALKENNIKSGNITLNGIIKGKLDSIVPQINVAIENINLYNKPNKTTVILPLAKVDATTKGTKVNGAGHINGLKIIVSGLPTFSIPNSKISFNEKDINLDSVYVMLNNSKIGVLGKVKNYSNSDLSINITAKGLLGANDIRSSLDRSIRNNIKATGRLPIIAKISGNSKVQIINAQILANNTNHLSIIDINSLKGKTSLINADLKIENNTLKINDISINSLFHNNGITENFNGNLSGSTKVLQAKGSISNLFGRVQNISGLNISIPNQVTISVPTFTNSQVQIKGDLNVSGTVTNPVITGMVNIPYASLPSIQTVGKNITVNATKNLIDVYFGNIKVADSVMQIIATMNSNFNRGVYIRSMTFNAENINADSLMKMISLLPQSNIAPGTDAGVTIASGNAKVERISSGTIVATNATSDFNLYNNLFKLNNVSASAYGGKIAGNITYNLLYSSTGINLQGRYLNANSAMFACTGMRNLMDGSLDFDAINLTARGLTDIQIMQSLKGKVKFIVSNGQMGALGKLENLLYAQNILANNLLKTTMSAVVGAVKVKKTGEFKYIKGAVSLSNGWATLERIQTSGPAMSMYIKGRVNILNNRADLIILGRLSNEVVSVLGPIGNFSVNSLIASIPKIGTVTSSLINQITTNPSGENLALLPDLSPAQANTKEFKAAINGSLESTSSVSYFKWLATPQASSQTSTTTSTQPSQVQQSAQQVLNTAKTNAQNAINKVLNLNNTTSTPMTPPANSNNNGVADFINNLPNLSN